MAMNDDSLLRQRVRPQSTLIDLKAAVRQPAPDSSADNATEPSEQHDYAFLPQPGSPYDAAHARASNKPVATLRFIVGETIRGLPYANYDSIDWHVEDKPGASPAIVMRFAGIIPREAIISGRHLLKLYDLLSDHRVAWVRELPKGKDFKPRDSGEAVITSIIVRRITEMPA